MLGQGSAPVTFSTPRPNTLPVQYWRGSFSYPHIKEIGVAILNALWQTQYDDVTLGKPTQLHRIISSFTMILCTLIHQTKSICS